MYYYKNAEGKPYFEPSEAVIAEHDLREIDQAEFDAIVVAMNTPSTEEVIMIRRSERDDLLDASDWTQMADTSLSADDKAAWATYRQALRDVPQQPGFPETIAWPETPGLGGQEG